MLELIYDISVFFFTSLISIFFRETYSRGGYKIPAKGAVIFVIAPHANQFVDPFILLKHCSRRVGFLVAKSTYDKKYLGDLAKVMNSIPVPRPQDYATVGKGSIEITGLNVVGSGTEFTKQIVPKDLIVVHKSITLQVKQVLNDSKLILSESSAELALGTNNKNLSYKVLPHLDQSQVYDAVFDRLRQGGCIGIFPEGGSHDRTEMLPLKAGVTIMALGAMAQYPGLDVKIVPCGLNYFHPHRFRSRAAIEFGEPIAISDELVEKFKQGGSAKREACSELLQIVYKSLRSVTVNVPNFEDLLVIQAARRLYKPPNAHLSIIQNLELTRNFAEGYLATKDKPNVQQLWRKVLDYNQMLKAYGLKDHQVLETAVDKLRAFKLLLFRCMQLIVLFSVTFPMILLNSPIFFVAMEISKRKASEALKKSTVKIAGKDVLATWKVIVALVLAPILYCGYSVVSAILSANYGYPFKSPMKSFLVTFISIPVLSYISLIIAEQGFDILRSISPLILCILPGYQEQSTKLRVLRSSLQKDIIKLVDDLGPEVFPNFDRERIINQASRNQVAYIEADSSDESGDGWLQWKEITNFQIKSEDILYVINK